MHHAEMLKSTMTVFFSFILANYKVPRNPTYMNRQPLFMAEDIHRLCVVLILCVVCSACVSVIHYKPSACMCRKVTVVGCVVCPVRQEDLQITSALQMLFFVV